MTRWFAWLATALFLGAVPRAQSLIGKAAYRPDSKTASGSPLLSPGHIWRELEPLPQVEIPDRLPSDLAVSSEDREGWDLARQANQAMSKGDAETARDLYLAYLELHPDRIQARVALADSLYALKEYKKAEAAYREALRSNPFLFQALNNLAWMYAALPDDPVFNPKAALRLATRARLIAPTSHHVWSTLSQIHYETGRYEEAVAAARNSLALAQRSNVGVPSRTLVQYMVQLDKSRNALQATSILE